MYVCVYVTVCDALWQKCNGNPLFRLLRERRTSFRIVTRIRRGCWYTERELPHHVILCRFVPQQDCLSMSRSIHPCVELLGKMCNINGKNMGKCVVVQGGAWKMRDFGPLDAKCVVSLPSSSSFSCLRARWWASSALRSAAASFSFNSSTSCFKHGWEFEKCQELLSPET